MSIDAMKQALEALEYAASCVQSNYMPDKGGHDWDEVMDTLRIAIEQAEKQEPVAHVVVVGDMVSVTTGSAGLKDLLTLGDGAPLYTTSPGGRQSEDCLTAAPVQEPVKQHPADEEIQQLRALVRAQQITIDKLEQQPAERTADDPVACLVETEQGVMVWPIADYNEASTYCDIGEFPTPLYIRPSQSEARELSQPAAQQRSEDKKQCVQNRNSNKGVAFYTTSPGGRQSEDCLTAAPNVTTPRVQYPLPDDLYDSKDWKSGSYAERVEWLHTMYESSKQTLEAYTAVPVQEPVAWMDTLSGVIRTDAENVIDDPRYRPLGFIDTPPAAPVQEPLTDEQIQDLLEKGNPTEDEARLIRLGYAAAQRPVAEPHKWVGMKDEQIDMICRSTQMPAGSLKDIGGTQWMTMFRIAARAIEAAHGIKAQEQKGSAA